MGKGLLEEEHETRLDIIARALPQFPPIQSHEWWLLQARQYDGGTCQRCQGLTTGEYAPPHDKLGECGVVERCYLCGWEHLYLAGRHGRPYR